ncbi:hypothetical protein CLOSTASPAR_03893 [[Clostridium] asparagiforme DSM 15981]|uniref:Uncharacterized protein n=1 Tax=[Clostridium] asparagiforme DSM 15981 TaxID=518636 RepID=C0D3Q2_9FIRM|nr:hypothetical protein CLOSTASPAR_03893 [[Clostridium] asparagiforme DSM 15981]
MSLPPPSAARTGLLFFINSFAFCKIYAILLYNNRADLQNFTASGRLPAP